MTAVLYARRKGWPLRGVRVDLTHEKVHAEDCVECETKEGWVDRIQTHLELEGDLTDEQRARLQEISERCPTRKTLTSEIVIISR